MGLFSKKIELKEEDFIKINSLLPERLKKNVWDSGGIVNGKLFNDYISLCNILEQELIQLNKKILKINENINSNIASKVLIFNTEIYNAKPLGMVDIGVVRKFGTTSTGNRFENDFIGYAIEGAFDNVWSENNSQIEAVQEVKLELLKKGLTIYPEFNLLFKFEIDFREIGSSGNVFIYARGTACYGENKLIEEARENIKKEIDSLEKEGKKLSDTLKKLNDKRKIIPSNYNELIALIEKNQKKG